MTPFQTGELPAASVARGRRATGDQPGNDFREMRGDDHAYLRALVPPARTTTSTSAVTTVDLFCGVGGLSLGIAEAARSVGRNSVARFACDLDADAVDCFRENFPEADVRRADVGTFLSSRLDGAITATEKAFSRKVGRVSILVGGPPCQGHSDLNNFSRRDDPKNSLYRFMGRAARVLAPDHVIIENVVGAAHDRSGVVDLVRKGLEKQGYRTTVGIIDALALGVPQSRRRLILLASRGQVAPISEIQERYRVSPKTLKWAIGDLEDEKGDSPFFQSSRPKPDTRKRIDYLFDNGLLNLPNSQRPACHRYGGHSYTSVYGRLSWDKPAQTITRGFYCMCMGRYVHPSRRRTLTAHEAARLQFFPDFFSFGPCKSRTNLATVIGNAVPAKIGYVLARELLTAKTTAKNNQETGR